MSRKHCFTTTGVARGVLPSLSSANERKCEYEQGNGEERRKKKDARDRSRPG